MVKGMVMEQRKHAAPVNAERPKGIFLEAASIILKRAKEPLTSKEITERAIASSLLQRSVGKTPDLSMANSHLSRHSCLVRTGLFPDSKQLLPKLTSHPYI